MKLSTIALPLSLLSTEALPEDITNKPDAIPESTTTYEITTDTCASVRELVDSLPPKTGFLDVHFREKGTLKSCADDLRLVSYDGVIETLEADFGGKKVNARIIWPESG